MTRPDSFESLANVVLDNLENQQDWSQLQRHRHASHPRILLSGLPPTRLYIHPDEQIDIIKAERKLDNGQRIPQAPEFEWVLPIHLSEKPSMSVFASVFDSIDALPPGAAAEAARDEADSAEWKQWRSSKRKKRVVLAVAQDDSTVVYYVMHDGIVKPRQN